MKATFFLPLLAGLSLAGCAAMTDPAANDRSASGRLPPSSRLPAGVANTPHNTGNPPEVLNPRSYSDQ